MRFEELTILETEKETMTDIHKGLTEQEAKERLVKHGEKCFAGKKEEIMDSNIFK